jgi:hypothetical protein
VEASNTPTIRCLTPSRRHQLSPIAHLIRDLSMAKNLSDAGVETLALIRSLALSLYCSTSYVTEWDAAYEAAETWCRSASN